MWRWMRPATSATFPQKVCKIRVLNHSVNISHHWGMAINTVILRFALVLLTGAFSPLAGAAGWSPLGGSAPSAAGLGMAYAGSTAIANDVSTVAANPAGMTQLEGARWGLGGQWQSPQYEPNVAGSASGNVASDVAGGYLYVSYPLSADWRLGLAVTQPYAFETRYASNWPGAATATGTQVQSQNINPALAYRVSDALSLGLGLNYETLKLDWSNTTDRYNAKGNGLGWNAGALFSLSPYMRLGVTYRSAIRHGLSGDLNGASGTTTGLTTPDTFSFSVWQKYSDQWEAGGEMAYVRWSQLGRLEPMQTTFNYRDAWRFAWGAAYQHNPKVKSRFGIAVERSPVVDDNRSVRLPEDQAVWLTLGMQYRVSRAGVVDAGFAYRLPSRPSVSSAVGGVNGDYRVGGQVLSLQYSHAY